MVPINGEKVAAGCRGNEKNKMASLIPTSPPLPFCPIPRNLPAPEVTVTFKIVNPDSQMRLKWAMTTEQDEENPVIAEKTNYP